MRYRRFTPEQVLFDAALASKHGDAIDDAIDIAIIGAVRASGKEEEMLAEQTTIQPKNKQTTKRIERKGEEGKL